MAIFAILDSDNKVVNIVVADSRDDLPASSTVVEDNKADRAGIGFSYDQINDTFVNPVVPLYDSEE